ncbi:hypothetical protein Pst134EA_011488 [Puccinia striiformis f. sp. tritici]|uniref:hypothetical protein n=1 Tax=Puccinia striiformis f. sp. tritici TaxID=168172 RepID=UPI0020085E80|nr:hypothetical protein Pst134EA_011488 [Puccinia striiformis f. sp. tritici]KAH9467870.1 hypothetical protein Pst134EA_011488 [Puccinia striiformis f. sp. tritici]
MLDLPRALSSSALGPFPLRVGLVGQQLIERLLALVIFFNCFMSHLLYFNRQLVLLPILRTV